LELTVRDAAGKIQTAGAALGITSNVDHWSDILGLMLLQNGADPANPTNNLAEDTLTFYTLFSRSDRVWDETLPSSTYYFASGRLAMYFGPSWRVFEIKALNPNLKFRVIPVPQLPGVNLTWASYWVEGVNKKSKYPTEAWEFLKFLSTPEVMQKLYQAQSKLRLFGEPYSRTDMADLLKKEPYVGVFIEQAPKAKSWYLCSRTSDNGINDKIIKYYEDAVNAVNEGASPKEALATVAQGVAQVLSQYGAK
jgi:multiple sugar transport system substrate-binding protein